MKVSYANKAVTNRNANTTADNVPNFQHSRCCSSSSSLEESNSKPAGKAVEVVGNNVIELASEESSDGTRSHDHTKGPASLKPVDGALSKESYSSDSDAEIRELAAKARERRRLQEEGQRTFKNVEEDGSPAMPASASPTSLNAKTKPDSVIEILITSVIPNTKPLIVQRRLSQRLKEVRLAWCERQDFSPDFTDLVFLTWRNRRLYDVTTCKNLQFKSQRKSQDSMDDDGEIIRVHLEAITEEILAATKQKTNSSGRPDMDKSDSTDIKNANELKAEQLKIKVRAPGYEDHKLIVKPVS